MRFWKNPEFVRHLRAELRTTRALTIIGVVLVICLLVWMGCWGSRESQMEAYRRSAHMFGKPTAAQLVLLEQQSPIEVWLAFYRFLMYAQLAALTFWSLFSCAQSISGERERKTWDFQRATRLNPGEFLLGKLLGEPVVAYFIVLCCLPITLVAGLLGHAGVGNILSGYLLIVSGALFIGLAGLWLSNLFESRSRGIGLIGTFGIYLLFGVATSWVNSNFPGAAALSPLTGMIALLQSDHPEQVPTIFGSAVRWPVMSLLLYLTLGAWLVLMILRGLKKDFDQMKPLSRWQAVGCAAFLNFMTYALFQPRAWDTLYHAEGFVRFMATVNGFVLFAMGLAMISSYDRLKFWWRTRSGVRSLLAEDGPPWPWLVVSGTVGYALLVWGMLAWKNVVGFDRDVLLAGLLQFLTVLVYVIRDILFLQWCRLTRMRAPLLKGFLFVALYYIAAIVLSVVTGVSSDIRGRTAFAVLTPAGAFDTGTSHSALLPGIFAGLAIQMAVIVLLLLATAARLRRTTGTLASSAAA
jgi:voltage-gated potassium channel Kch